VSDRLHLFGIRHHGPGCAHSLARALDRLDPAMVLIEGPPEAESVLAFAASPDMVPPVALLAHAPDRPGLASFYPLAEFSPEWIAIRWAQNHDRPVRFIDLPATHNLALRAATETRLEASVEAPVAEQPEAEPSETPPLDETVEVAAETAPAESRDPLAALAELAGYGDVEAWWNSLIEEGTHPETLFAAIETAMTAVRERAELEQDPTTDEAVREALREAHMRLAIRAGLDTCEGPVAAVVGAWHLPALRRKVSLKDDKALLKGLPKIDVAVTWTPWTDARLARNSGYGAGVVSPGWYRHLWAALEGREALDARTLAVGWQARVAGLLRDEGLAASTASVIEAVRLAETLAALRDRGAPGLDELNEASLATLCHGQDAPMRLIEQRLVIGARVGSVDAAVPLMPLLADLARQQKKLRLKPEAVEIEASLDLRSEIGLAKSALLHRLTLIDVPWGRLTDVGGSRGTFRERWILLWEPELGVALAEALRWGVTILDAASEAAVERAEARDDPAAIAELVRATLLADLPRAAERCIDRLQSVAARSGDVGALMRAAAPLAETLRYGQARAIPEAPLRRLIETMIEEVCVGLPVACRQLDDTAAAAMLRAAAGLEQALPLLDRPELTADWRRALGRLIDDDAVAARLRGFAARKLYDGGDGVEATAERLSRALSPSVAPPEAAAWLEGFLDDAGRLLLHDQPLLDLLDDWLKRLAGEDLEALLPQLRRAFSGLDRMERRRLLSAATDPRGAGARSGDAAADGDEAAFRAALPLLKTLLGLSA
jgi:hypothetical protein